MSFFGLLKSLESMQTEREHMKNGKEVLFGESFITGGSSLLVGILYLLLFLSIGIFLFFKSFFAACIGFSIGLVYYYSYKLEFLPRSIIIISSIIISQIILNIKSFF